MKCIDKYLKTFICILVSGALITGCASQTSVGEYEADSYKRTSYKAKGFSDALCVATEDVTSEAVNTDSALHAAGLFSMSEKEVLYSYNIHKKLYPASTTKILTALLALKHSDPSDTVTVSKTATTFPVGASLAHLKEGDTITMEELLYGLMLPSGNDAAVAIAEHISGSVEEFAKLMNQEAFRLGATNTHFVNPHGLHEDNHYTTAYDLYLIFNECLKYESFVKVIETTEHVGSITGKDGQARSVKWNSTSLYTTGEAKKPTVVEYRGGKTGNTDEAKRCLIAYSKDAGGNGFISIVMGAGSKPLLYENMNEMLDNGITAN